MLTFINEKKLNIRVRYSFDFRQIARRNEVNNGINNNSNEILRASVIHLDHNNTGL